MAKNYRIGLIVPSSNTTMETEIPAMLRNRQEMIPDETFTFHSSRMRMLKVTKEELKQMDCDSDRCAIELSDAACDAMAYACLVAIMTQGPGYHEESEARLTQVTATNGQPAPVISSAGALVKGLSVLGAKKVSLIAPYMKPLTQLVVEYIESCGVQVMDSISLEVPDNREVGRLDPMNLVKIVDSLDIREADAVILSACVQMPSLPAIQIVEDKIGLPVLSAATSTVFQLLQALHLQPVVPHAGRLLSGKVNASIV